LTGLAQFAVALSEAKLDRVPGVAIGLPQLVENVAIGRAASGCPLRCREDGYVPLLAFIALGNPDQLGEFSLVRHPQDLTGTKVAGFMAGPIQ
jgi:hypothetical protein